MTAAPQGTTIRCLLCGEQFKVNDTVMVRDQQCCRPCSVSVRSDLTLLDRFVAWHDQSNVSDLRVTRKPTTTEFRPGIWAAVVEFELPDLIGSILLRADGQCDADYLRLSTEEAVFTYAILTTADEVTEHLAATYEAMKKREQDAP